ncbi:MAG TPA: VWA domain-containing protein, partial [Bryobacterales bacterium]|nr:VWA domain-containing protein [Bryobacterales bacterium]
ENGKQQTIATFEYVGEPGSLTAGEATPRAGQSADKGQSNRSAVTPGPPVRIFILTEGQIAEQSFLYQGMRKFIEEQIPPGTLVSLGTRPFTADRENLLETLDEMTAHPFGRKDSESGDWLSGFYDETTVELAKLERDRLNTVREARSGESLLGAERYNNHDGNHPNIEMRPPRLRQIDQRIRLLGRQKLRDYLGLVRRLGSYPGKKIVVLFRSGLRLEPENMDLMEPIASESLRNRVSFYTIDSRGLETWIVNASMGVHPGRLMDNEGIQSTRMPIVREIRHRGQDSQYGLRALADHTGGRAVKNTNDLNDIFEVVVPDVYGYYLLGYYPRDDRQRGRFRKVEVRSKRRGVRVETGRGYFEPVQFTQMSEREKSAHLNQAILADSYASELPIRVGHDFFRAEDGQPVVVFGVSAPVAELVTRSAKGNDRVEFTVAARAERMEDGASWIYRSAGYRHESTAADSQEEKPGGAFVDFTGQVPVPPGQYKWVVLIRNDADGRIGRYDGTLTVPNLSDGFTSSTLLLAAAVSKPEAQKLRNKGRKKNRGIDSVLQFHQGQIHPEYRGEFHQGQQVFFLYDLYNLQPEDISTPPPIRVVLRRGERDVEDFSAVGDLEPRSERRQVRYLGAIDTSSLTPGSYRLSTYFPGQSGDQPVVLSREFRVTGPSSGR